MMTDLVAAVHADPLLTSYQSPLGGAPAPVPGTLGVAHRYDWTVVPPCVTWIPSGDTFEAPMAQGRNLTPRAARSLWRGFEVAVHAQLSPVGNVDDFGTCEDLVDRFLYAVHRTLLGSYRLGSGRFIGQQSGEQIFNDRKVYVVNLAVGIPVIEPAGVTGSATITSVPVAGEMDFLDGKVVGPLTPPP